MQTNADILFRKKLLSLDCPSKAQHFLWRACRGSLAVNEVRFCRHISLSPLCFICDLAPKSIYHALVSCQHVLEVWKDHPGESLKFEAPKHSFLDMFRWLLEKCSYEVLISIVSTLWAIWFVRNRKIFKGGSIDIKANVASFANVFHDYTSYAAKVFTSAKQLDSTTLNRWYRPNDG